IETIAEKIKYTIDTYGNDAIYIPYSTGTNSTTANPYWRMFNMMGGSQEYWGNYSCQQLGYMAVYMYGDYTASTLDNIDKADLYIGFGANMVETTQGGGCGHTDYVRIRENTNCKIIHIDPRLTDTIAGHCDQWIPINPGTDAALVAAIAHYLIEHDMVDLDFLHTYCQGYDEETMPEAYQGKHMSYHDYVMGSGYDMIEKTSEWASHITGITPDIIDDLADQIGRANRLYSDQGVGAQRRSNGEWQGWSIMTLPCLVGQVGKPGTNSGFTHGNYTMHLSSLPQGENPITTTFPCFMYLDAIDHGHEFTATNAGLMGGTELKSDIKFIFYSAGNALTNQHGGINQTHEILADESKCEFIVVSDVVMCDSAKYADILLPDSFRFEQNSTYDSSSVHGGGITGYILCATPCTTPKYERKNAYEIATLISRAMGTEEEFTEGRTQEEWIKYLYESDREKDPDLPSYEEFKEMGIYKRENPNGTIIAHQDFIEDPINNPLSTPSGKIEIFSTIAQFYSETFELADDEKFGAIPMYIPEWYGVETTTEECPLLLTGFHYKGRTHSSWGNVEILKEANPETVWINPSDAAERGIESGDPVSFKNQFCEVQFTAYVTPRIVPGTVAMAQGAWHDADMYGDQIDHGGCINTLTSLRPSPMTKGNTHHTNICQVTKL
ncbi:MAG: molybdopterin-dependent oxidoreductase, partial [Eggerthellaceae bacterium]|nr:molybdopterin-dependent oxidoreductase [Eggerthellaceae bacterium]